MIPEWNPHPQNQLCNLRTFDHNLFRDFSIKPFFVVISGQFFNVEFLAVSEDELMNYFTHYEKLIVVKEEFGRGGNEVTIIKSAEFDPGKLIKGKNYVIQPYIEQLDVLRELHPGSVNTFRVKTFLELDGSISVRFVFFRFGTNGSRVDNLASSGKFLFFDAAGKPSESAFDKLCFEVGKKHGNTGFKFSDIRIPAYHEMLEKWKAAHRKFPYVRLIGWDFCIDKEGTPILLEWNADHPHIDTLEAKFGPFFPEWIRSFPSCY